MVIVVVSDVVEMRMHKLMLLMTMTAIEKPPTTAAKIEHVDECNDLCHYYQCKKMS
jgi:delta 1-pyrroline-5-carboxylate dehydrogenase